MDPLSRKLVASCLSCDFVFVLRFRLRKFERKLKRDDDDNNGSPLKEIGCFVFVLRFCLQKFERELKHDDDNNNGSPLKEIGCFVFVLRFRFRPCLRPAVAVDRRRRRCGVGGDSDNCRDFCIGRKIF